MAMKVLVNVVAVIVQMPGIQPAGGTSVHSSGELPEGTASFNIRGGGPVLGASPFTHVRTGSVTLSTLSRGAGQFGSGHSTGVPGGMGQALGAAGWGASTDAGRPTGPPQHSQSVPATPIMLMDSASGVAAGGRFAVSAAERETHSASAPVLPTGSSSGHQPHEVSCADGSTSPSAPAASQSETGPAAGELRRGSDSDADPHTAATTATAAAALAAEQQLHLGGGAAKQPSRGPSAADGSGSAGGGAQPCRAGLRKNKFSSFSSDLPPDRHWPPGAASSAGTDSTTPVDASPSPQLRPEQQVCDCTRRDGLGMQTRALSLT